MAYYRGISESGEKKMSTTPHNVLPTRDELHKITGKAILDFDPNPAFIGFRLMSWQSANAAIKKINEAGYKATYMMENFVKVELIKA